MIRKRAGRWNYRVADVSDISSCLFEDLNFANLKLFFPAILNFLNRSFYDAFSNHLDIEVLASFEEDEQIILWDVKTSQEIGRLPVVLTSSCMTTNSCLTHASAG